jgi:hypothetical protein
VRKALSAVEEIWKRLVDEAAKGRGWARICAVASSIDAISGFPLAPSIPNRAAMLRFIGNAINPYLAAEFIAAVMERET